MDRLLTGDEVKKIRQNLRLSVRKMADVMGASHVAVSKWERGKYVSDGQKKEMQRMLFLYIQKQSEFCNQLAVALRFQNGNQ